MSGYSGFLGSCTRTRVNCNYKIVFALTHIICIRVAAATEEVVYEVVAKPKGPQRQAPQQEAREESVQGPTHPSVEQQTQGKPRCMSYYFKL